MKKEEFFVDDSHEFDIEEFVRTHTLEEILQIEKEMRKKIKDDEKESSED